MFRACSRWLITALLFAPSLVPGQDVDSAPGLLLNAAAQNEAVFLSWSKVEAASYSVYWRPLGRSRWQLQGETTDTFFVVDSLTNGKPYEFQVAAHVPTTTIGSDTIRIEPRRRSDCSEPTHYIYCTQESFLNAVNARSAAATQLFCGRHSVQLSGVIPNCIYRVEGRPMLLDRYSGSSFEPPWNLRKPQLIRRVLLRTIWGTEDLDRIKAEAADRVLELSEPKARVDTLASVRSFLVSIAPQLYSRVTWFARPDHVAGRYAIYHEGHLASATTDGTPVVRWLLSNGWQVFALDMPLEGLNAVDRRYPLFSHADFALYDDGEVNPLQWFFLPVAAVMHMIQEDAGPKQVPTVLMVGRSGGGWTTMVYSAMDSVITVAVNIAGSSPASTQLSDASFPGATPEYEQQATRLYDQVPLTDILLTAGSKASIFFYSANDPCCFRFSMQNAWIRYLSRLESTSTQKMYRVFIGDTKVHGLTPQSLSALQQYLHELGLGETGQRNVR